MESKYPDLALCDEHARTDTVFFPISEVSEGTVSLGKSGDRQSRGPPYSFVVARNRKATQMLLNFKMSSFIV